MQHRRGPRTTYRALVRFLSRVAPHVDDEHVLRLEGLLLPRAASPLAHEDLLVHGDVIVVQMLKKRDKSLSGTDRYASQKRCSPP